MKAATAIRSCSKNGLADAAYSTSSGRRDAQTAIHMPIVPSSIASTRICKSAANSAGPLPNQRYSSAIPTLGTRITGSSDISSVSTAIGAANTSSTASRQPSTSRPAPFLSCFRT